MFWKRAAVRKFALSPDEPSNSALSVLRDRTGSGGLKDHVKFVRGFSLRADPALGLSGRYNSPIGRLLELDANISGQGEWLALHLALPDSDLSSAGVLGFAARLYAPETCVLRACVRSGTETGFQDCFFDKHLLLRPEEVSHFDGLPIGMRAELPEIAPWRELVFFLPTDSFRLSLIDLRVFVV